MTLQGYNFVSVSRRAPDVLALEVLGVGAAQRQLAAGDARHVAVEPEGEHRLLDQALVHHVLERWRRAVDRDLREAHALRICIWVVRVAAA